MDFSVTYSNVPFVTDIAKVIRMPPPEVPHGQVDKQQPIRKQQPEIDLIDELNRILPFQYSQDYFLSTYYHNRNLGDIARPNYGPNPNPTISIWDYYYPTNASRWSVFRGLATSSMVAQLLANVIPFVSAGAGPLPFYQAAPFTILQFPNSPDAVGEDAYTVTTNLYMLPPRPIAEHGGGFDGLYSVVLVDSRFWWQFLPVSFEIKSNTTWDSLIAQIAQNAGITIGYSPIAAAYGQPEPDSQLWCNSENLAALFDAVAANLGRVVVRNFDGTYTLQTYEEAQEVVLANRGDAVQVVRFAGGDIFEQNTNGTLLVGNLTPSRNMIVPSNVLVTFPQYVVGNDPVPHYVNKRYGNPRPTCWYETSYGGVYGVLTPITSGGPLVSGLQGVSGYTHCIHDTAKALYSGENQANATYVEGIGFTGGVPLNYNGLVSLANQITSDYYYGQALEALDESYLGTFAWEPEGIHDLIWRYSERTRQATCRVAKQQWNNLIREMQHSTPYCSGLVSCPGVGGPSVAQTWKDSYSGSISTITTTTFLSGGSFLTLNDISYLPTQNRWKAVINSGKADYEIMLLEGTSGGLGGLNTVSIAQQGIDGTAPNSHANNASVIYLAPDTTYGVNLVEFEKGQFVYPGEWRSGGVQGVTVVPQVQTVFVYDGSGTYIRSGEGAIVYSGQVFIADPINSNLYKGLEHVWVEERNGNPLSSGHYYNGQLFAYSTYLSGQTSGTISPIYLVNQDSVSTLGINVFDTFTSLSGSAFDVTSGLKNFGVHASSGVGNDGSSASGFLYGRLFWTDLSASGLSGQGQLDWQGFRLFQSGQGYVGPGADLAVLPGSGITTGVSFNAQSGLVQLSISTVGQVSGITVTTENVDGTATTSPTTQLIADNSYSGYQFGRLLFTNLSASGIANATQLDWQGIKLYNSTSGTVLVSGILGSGYVGPEPDIEFVNGSGTTWTIGNSTAGKRLLAQVNVGINISGTEYLPFLATDNVDATALVFPTTLVTADNTFPTVDNRQFGRIAFTQQTLTTTQLDWQGLQLYYSGAGYVGPEPDIEFVAGSGTTWILDDDIIDGRVQAQVNITITSGLAASGVIPYLTTENIDTTQKVNPTTLIVADNYLPQKSGFAYSGYWFGRIQFSSLASGTVVQGAGSGFLSSGQSFIQGTQLDWQGQLLYHSGEGYFGPEPDIEFVDGSGTSWKLGNNITDQRVTAQVNALTLKTQNIDGTQVVDPTTLIKADNSYSGHPFGRILFTKNAANTTIVDWQGFSVYENSLSTSYGPEPDLLIVNPGNGVYWNITDDTANKVIQLQANVSGATTTISQSFVTGVTCSGGVIGVTTKVLYLDFQYGLLRSGVVYNG